METKDSSYVKRLESENIRLKKQVDELLSSAFIDELTGLYNRKGFYLLVEQQLKTFRRKNLIPHLFYIDVDNLKPINDTKGHQAGDQLLQILAKTLKSTFREIDIIARFGGDEFVILAGILPEQLTLIQDRLYKALHNQKLMIEISLGVVTLDSIRDLNDAITEADYLMYEQKVRRKNVSIQDQEISSRAA